MNIIYPIIIFFLILICFFYIKKYKKASLLIKEIEFLTKTGHWELDLIKNKLKWSDQIYSIFEIDKKDFQSTYQAFLNTVHPEDKEMVDQAFQKALQTKEPYYIEHRILLKDNKVKYLLDRSCNIYNKKHTPVRSVGTVHDITKLTLANQEKEKTEKYLMHSQKLESLGNFAVGIAHDFGNILTPIYLITEDLLENMPQNSQQYEDTKTILNEVERAKKLIKQILIFSKKQDKELMPVYIGSIVKEVVKFIKSSTPSNVKIQSTIPNNLPPVLADPTEIHQIFMNLFSNAIHAMDKQESFIKIDIVAENITKNKITEFYNLTPGSYIKIIFEDNGCGINSKFLKKIFDPYFTQKKPEIGTGLGLYTVHKIINNYKGAIEVTSKEKTGTKFTFYFPLHSD